MKQIGTLLVGGVALATLGILGSTIVAAQDAEKRVALVIGNSSYANHPLATAANDAGLIAQTLQAAGFDVVGARDLDQNALRQSFHDFHDKVAAAGPNAVAMIYLNGYALQFEGENYFVPVDAKIQNANDVPSEALRISDFTKSMSDLGLKAEIVVLDAAHENPFRMSGSPLAGGLALTDAQPGMLVAYNASPGTVAQPGQGPYGIYAQSLSEMIRQGGLSLNEVFQQTNLRVNEQTKGAEVPWDDSKISEPIQFFTLSADAPPPPVPHDRMVAMETQPIRSFTAADAYAAAIERGTMQGYLDFLAAYPDDPMARRIRAIVAARREAVVWRHTWEVDTPPAYWSYLRRYPKGPHVWDARRRLRELAAAFDPPASFDEIEYDVPPPPPEEIIIVDQPVIYFGAFDYAPPPPPPPYFLPPPPPAFYHLPPPPPPSFGFFLPVPVFVPMQAWVEHPHNIVPPPPNGPNIYYENIHNSVTVDINANTLKITTPQGQPVSPPPPPPQNANGQPAPHFPLMAPSLPGSLAKQIQNPNFKLSPPSVPSNVGQPPIPPAGGSNLHKLPGPLDLPVGNKASGTGNGAPPANPPPQTPPASTALKPLNTLPVVPANKIPGGKPPIVPLQPNGAAQTPPPLPGDAAKNIPNLPLHGKKHGAPILPGAGQGDQGGQPPAPPAGSNAGQSTPLVTGHLPKSMPHTQQQNPVVVSPPPPAPPKAPLVPQPQIKLAPAMQPPQNPNPKMAPNAGGQGKPPGQHMAKPPQGGEEQKCPPGKKLVDGQCR